MIINEQTLNLIVDKIKSHHQLYRFPVKAELWEDIFDQSINGLDSNWNIGGHSSGADVICEKTGIKIQNKGGEFNHKKSTVKWNGHRTTSHLTIQDKVDFISQKHYDVYAMLGRNKNEWNKGIKKYYLLTFDSSLIDYSKLNWVETFSKKGKLTGWVGTNENLPYSATISISMSGQLWTECDINYLGNPIEIIVQ